MATYNEAADANELISDVARFHNTVLNALDRIIAIRTKLVAMDATTVAAVRAAIQALGYSDTEIEAILNKWNQVNNTVIAQALVPVKQPR